MLKQIKIDQLAARKSGDKQKAAVLTTLISEVELMSRTAGKDVDVVTLVIKKLIKNIDICISLLKDASNTDGSADHYVNQLKEKSILEEYLPKQLDEVSLTNIISEIISAVGKNTGSVMKELKLKYSGQYDGKMASEIVKKLVG